MDESQEVVLADLNAAPEQVATAVPESEVVAPEAENTAEAAKTCLLYTSDAADE